MKGGSPYGLRHLLQVSSRDIPSFNGDPSDSVDACGCATGCGVGFGVRVVDGGGGGGGGGVVLFGLGVTEGVTEGGGVVEVDSIAGVTEVIWGVNAGVRGVVVLSCQWRDGLEPS